MTTGPTQAVDDVSQAIDDIFSGYDNDDIRTASWLVYVNTRVAGYPRFDQVTS
jgi:hypothetical protein